MALAAPSFAATYYDSQASAHVGETATIEGRVTDTHISSTGTEFMNFGGRYPNQDFTAVVFPTDAAQIGNVSQYAGKMVSVTGKIRLYKGKPEITVSTSDQLHIMS